MTIKFCGAAGTTTGSQHLISVNGQQILLDCGLYQGHRLEAFERNRNFPFHADKIDAVVLSHAHIDHSGNLPNLVNQGYTGNIYCTPATRDLCSIMLPDSARIQAADTEWLNRKRKDGPALEPAYSEADAQRTLLQMVTIGYHRPQIVADGVKMTFIDAGHVLGSAQIILDITDHATGRDHRLLFSGDVGRPNNDLLANAEVAEDVDHVIMESTYGGRKHELSAQTSEHICDIIRRTVEKRGKVIIPAFAVERTQQLLFTLDKLHHTGCLPSVEVYVDSPLAVDATNIFRLHREGLRPDVRDAVFMKDDPFGFSGLHLIRTVEGSRKLNDLIGPAIIISASGMAENGRVLHHLRNNIENPNNTVLFVGYCAENTLGWRLREGFKRVRILGDDFIVGAHIEILDSFSGHADHDELLQWFGAITGPKKHVYLVHGEPTRSAALAASLQEKFPDSATEVAHLLQQVSL